MVHRVGRARAFTAEQKRIARLIGEAVKGLGAPGGEQNQSALGPLGRLNELRPRRMQPNLRLIAVVQGGALEGFVRQRKGAGLYNIEPNRQTCGQSKGRTEVLRNVRLKKGQTHSKRSVHKRSAERARGGQEYYKGASALPRGLSDRVNLLQMTPRGSRPSVARHGLWPDASNQR